MKRLGIIGHGRIGRTLINGIESGQAGHCVVAGVLTRKHRQIQGVATHTDLSAFLATDYDLIIDVAGPAALKEIAPNAIAVADIWTVSAVALADDDFAQTMVAAIEASGHELRVLPGVIAGIDSVKAVCVDPDATLHVRVDMPAGSSKDVPFSGTAREAAARFPNNVNIATAAALAGPGLDRTKVTVTCLAGAEPRSIIVEAKSSVMDVKTRIYPNDHNTEPVHPVGACLIAALADIEAPIAIY